ncbi:MAG: tRNA pseudouridine(55) synthase TruB [Candidatus Muiribacterium halophilum]|uniref:tRNA pseudouridine synthase B n=1 Tax=Muiribacterium halophilum TaxID=2053465 RepID=A0A2N5ZK64_MUIH1|nr:MAG: tRNA pseudouridine(55) synthase TruB [Candidatus Muirbacterium halophilum]
MLGILLINKDKDMSSFDVIRKLRKKGLNSKKFKTGYLGTLDPMAKGVLPILIGKATKLADLFQADRKKYIGRILIGKKTDTYDVTGNVLEEVNEFKMPSSAKIKEILSTFRGRIMQTPPAVSAKKINGKRAYEIFRKGDQVELNPVEVNIKSINLIEVFDKEFVIEVECSKGTYIRSIANDFGEKLGIPATLSGLTRSAVGDFILDNCITLDKINDVKDIKDNLLDINTLLHLPKLCYREPKRIANGIFIKNREGFEDGSLIKVISEENKILAIYKTYEGTLKPEVVLV